MLENVELTADEIRIAKIQKELARLGWQWVEHIYNDGALPCSIKFTKRQSPMYFTDHCMGDMGWGRFSRIYCWNEAYTILTTKYK